MSRRTISVAILFLLGLGAARADAQLVEPSCPDLRSAIESVRAPAFEAVAEPPRLGFRSPCTVEAERGPRQITCHQYAGFTSALFEHLVAKVAACLPMAELESRYDPQSGMGPRQTHIHRIGDVSVSVAQTGFITRRGNDVWLTIRRIEE